MWDSIRLGLMARKCRSGALPPFICEYLEHRKAKPTANTPIDELRFVVYDTETTGLNIHKDRLLSIGAVTVVGDSIMTEEAFHRVVHSEYFDYRAAAVHGLTATEVRAGSEVDPALEHFLQTLRADIVVAHHAGFDVRMVEQSIRRNYASSFFLYNHILDTAHLAKKLELPDTPKEYIDHSKFTLDSLCERYNISQADRHTAWGDAYITAKLMLILLKRLKARGVNTLGKLF
jgi:DNA polymerase-3 subunit epsilon